MYTTSLMGMADRIKIALLVLGEVVRAEETFQGVSWWGRYPTENHSSLHGLQRGEKVVGDERFVYGATCTWFGSIHEADETGRGIPCCPHCQGVLYELQTEADWNRQAKRYAEKSGDADYPTFLYWARSYMSAHGCLPLRDRGYATLRDYFTRAQIRP